MIKGLHESQVKCRAINRADRMTQVTEQFSVNNDCDDGQVWM